MPSPAMRQPADGGGGGAGVGGVGGGGGDTASYQDWMCPLVKNVLAAAEISCRRHQFADVVHRT